MATESLIYRVAVPLPLWQLFDYHALPDAQPLVPGCRVLVRFGARRLMGLVVQVTTHSAVPAARLQPILAAPDGPQPMLSAELLDLLRWCAAYYKHPVGEVLCHALPPALRRADRSLPEPPFQYRLSPSGQERLAQGPGRAPAQYRLLEALAQGALSPAALRQQATASAAQLRTVEQQGWLRREALGAGRPAGIAGPSLTAEQQAALTAMSESAPGFACHLLDGITGSGKTEVYLRLVEQVLQRGQQALILVPEIGLTPQLLRRFQQRFGLEPVVSHSAMASGARLTAWAAALRGEAQLFIGTRSALFLPLQNPGLLIVDEAHDASFKQQDGFRYGAADVAVKRAQALQVPVVLGTATPTLEMLHNADLKRYAHHRLRQRATGAPEPVWRVVDMRQQRLEAGLSPPALTAIADTLARGEQVLVFLNRRGYAPVLLCHECGWHGECHHCDANMTWHRQSGLLQCHHCGAQAQAPRFCPVCRADALTSAGEGTEQLEQFLQQRFPDIPLYRVDRDRVRRKGELEAVVEAVREGEPCMLVGTQMLAKGHHFPKVTLVVVVSLDQALYSADYRALERLGQLLVQVGGRAGRERRPGTVLMQTHHPEHAALQCLLKDGFEAFARGLLEERQLAQLPPFAYQAVLRAEGQQRSDLQGFLDEALACWPGPAGSGFGPFPAMMERRGGLLRWQLLLQSEQRAALQAWLDSWLTQVQALASGRKVRWDLDLDPQEF